MDLTALLTTFHPSLFFSPERSLFCSVLAFCPLPAEDLVVRFFFFPSRPRSRDHKHPDCPRSARPIIFAAPLSTIV